jgi:hypothetical protein
VRRNCYLDAPVNLDRTRYDLTAKKINAPIELRLEINRVEVVI